MIAAGAIRAYHLRRERERKQAEEEMKRWREVEEAKKKMEQKAAMDLQRRLCAARNEARQNAQARTEALNSIPRGLMVEYQSEQMRKDLKQIGLEGCRCLKFSAQSMSLEGYVSAGSSNDIIRVVFTQRPRNYDEDELGSLLFNGLARKAKLAMFVDKATRIASRRGLPVPDVFICPITLSVMRDPVIATDGHTYEYSAIAEWLRVQCTSPLTKATMKVEDLQTNLALRSDIEEWVFMLFPWASIETSTQDLVCVYAREGQVDT
mmetsp:Transcript_56106/g.148200  ORF Transcript_56106/g.148200 Transcript_56106/m.148200 type:complete len:264 (+) Transcript_56106:3-794(+)